MITYGIVGIGGFAATWVEDLRTLEERGIARLGAAVVRNRDKYQPQLQELEERDCSIYGTLEEMLEGGQEQIDVVGVPTGISYHAPMAIQAMEAGYNVLIEKPVAATIQEVRELQECERRTGRWCAVGYQWIYGPTMRWLAQKVTDGRLGMILEGRTMISWPRDRGYYTRNSWAGRLGEPGHWILDGPATNATAHYLTNIFYLIAAQQGEVSIKNVRGELYAAKAIETYDTSCIAVDVDGIPVLHLVSHAVSESFDPRTRLICEKGIIDWQADTDTAIIEYDDGRREKYVNAHLEENHLGPLHQIAQVAAGQAEAPLCGLKEGGPHVLTIDLAFESSVGVHRVPEEYVYPISSEDGSETAGIRQMEAILQEAYESGCTFSELDTVPWAIHTDAVPAEGYDHFPQGDSLKEALGVDESEEVED
ncbi:MAG: Gfo/Idh/MocA family oxidoreductase [Chloroflexota bacterium]|nr:Gfo/Idh/MocA family oxidoreductase [Chloroflexota bacterium]